MRNFFSVFLFYIRQICFIFKGRLYNSIESLKLSVKYLQGYLHVSFLSPRSFLYVVVFQLVAKQSLTERELLLFPLICADSKCREHRFKRLSMCGGCGEVAFCKDKPEHRGKEHAKWCGAYQIFKAFIMFQEKFGRMEPSLPSKILRELPMACSNTKQMMKKLSFSK